MYSFIDVKEQVHRIIPSKFPPVLLFDWASSAKELEQIALLEGLTNERIQAELGRIHLVSKEDWVSGQGATPLMAAFTHNGFASRFTDGSYGIYYAATSLDTAIKETLFHREQFYKASKEPACSISMREYVAKIKRPLVDIRASDYDDLFHPDPHSYPKSQEFGRIIYDKKYWGLFYPSVRNKGGICTAIFRPPALTIPTQGCHLRYIWDGNCMSDVYIESRVENLMA